VPGTPVEQVDVSGWPTYNGIPYLERPGSGSMEFSRDLVTAKQIFLVEWSRRYDFIREILPSASIVNGQVVYVPPVPFPTFLECVAQTCTIDGYAKYDNTDLANSIHYQLATVVINFSTVGFVADQTALITKQLEFSGEMFQPGRNSFRFVSDNKAVDEPPGIFLPHIQIQIEKHYVPTFSLDLIVSLLGRINSVIFQNVAIGLVRYDGASAAQTITLNGPRPWSFVHKFTIRTINWNFAYRPGVGWRAITSDDGPPFLSGNFNSLLA